MAKRSKKKKRQKYIFIFVIIVISLFAFNGYYFYVYKRGVNYKSKITIEVGEKIPVITDYVLNEDIDRVGKEITWEDIPLDDEGRIFAIGEYNGVISFREETLNVKLIVKDSKPPVIEGVKDIEMLAYEIEPDLLKDISASDNSGEEINVIVEGEYDTKVASTYKLNYIAKDSSGNERLEAFKLIVKENTNVKISKTSKGNEIKNYYGITYIDDIVVVNKTYNLPSNFAPNNLVTINGYIKVVDYVKDAFTSLAADAQSLGLNIYASSGYRSYNDQNYIYNNYVKWDGQENADTYSARAGHSEHQTGLAIDLNTIDSSFEGTPESNWLKDNCYKYGFIIRYPKDKDSITGYMYEPWHIRYVGKEFAQKLYNNGNWITIEEYYGIDSKYK